MTTKSCAWIDYNMVQNIINGRSRIVGKDNNNVTKKICPKSIIPSFPYAQHGDGLLKDKVKQR